MLIWIFGAVKNLVVEKSTLHTICGKLELENANVNWFLSIDYQELPIFVQTNNLKTYRNIAIDGAEIEFSEGFTDLHTVVYEDILNGNGFGILDARAAIELVSCIRKFRP